MYPTDLARIVRQQLTRHQEQVRRCRKKPATEVVHRMRVLIRRLLAELALLAPSLPARLLKLGRGALKRRLHSTAALRDVQVQLQAVEVLRTGRAGLTPFRRHLRRRERRLADAVAAELARRKPNRRLAALARKLDRVGGKGTAAWHPRGMEAIRLLERAHVRVARLAGRVPFGRRERHRLRIALKRYRYLAEVLPPADCPLSSGQLQRLRIAQRRLGELRDLMLLEKRLRRFADWHPGDSHLRMILRLLAQRRAGRERRQHAFVPALVQALAPHWPAGQPGRKLR
jgi:CHAD domain-containing protein